MNYKLILFSALFLMLSSACSTSRRAARAGKKDLSSAYLMDQMAQHKVEADWFSSRIRVSYDDGEQSVSGSATLRMKMDSVVWMSVKKFGLELARVQVTRDSVYVLDRINNEFTAEGLSYLAESYGLPASLRGLQDFLLGNAVFLSPPPYEVQTLGPTYRLSANDEKLGSDIWVDAAKYHVHKMAFDDKANEQKVEVLLEEFGPTDDQQNFSYLRTLNIDGKSLGKMNIGLKFSKVEINIPKSIRFEIPSKYSRTD